MRKFSKVALVLALLLMVSALPAFAEGIVVTDMTGREVKLQAAAQRIVALTPSDCEIVFALGADDKVVGRGQYCDYPAQVAELPALQSGKNLNLEEVIALTPDLVIMGTMGHTQEQVEALEKAGIAVLVTDADTIADVYKNLELLGQVTGKEGEAKAIVADMQARFDAIREKAKGKESKSVYFEVSPLQYGLYTAGKGTFMQEIADIVGLKNAFEDIEGWASVSEEQVIERDPDYIVTITMYFGEGPKPEEEIMARTGWDKLKAVTEKQVILMNGDELSRPAPRLVQGAETLFDIVWGEEAAAPAA